MNDYSSAAGTTATPQRLPATHDRPRPELARRVVIERVRPEIDGGRFPIKRTIGETVDVVANAFADGHDVIAVVLLDRPGTERSADQADRHDGWRETPMASTGPGTDGFAASFVVEAIGWHEYRVAAWVDRFRSWRRDLAAKAAAGQDVAVELVEGALLVRDAAARAKESARGGTGRADADWLTSQASALSGSGADRVTIALAEELDAVMARHADRTGATYAEARRVWVDRERARFGAWYEMFPRSAGPDPDRSGTFAEAAARLPDIADLGFDVVYLPPIHPIGTSFRKGRNNTLAAAPDDPGSPWAIGSPAGGHTAIDPGLGTFDDFHAFRDEAERLGLEIALDLAWQCSPDHPWVHEHPEWFRHRPDGTIKYAENPPKRYQDIYPFDFECRDWQALWLALRDVALFWIGHGVRIFRVDNPHTKTLRFWEWFIAEIHARHPDVIFLSEAFTRPAPMRYLAKAGFTQSYTYFTWRNSRQELTEYFTELTATEVREYLRPNLFTNTPDILHAYLQYGGRPAFEARLLLAATLGASYGIYNGFELCEARAMPDSEEYADSEKYEYRKWDWDRPGHIKELVGRVNSVRRQCLALQSDWSLRFHATDNPEIIAYSKSSDPTASQAAPGSGEVLLVVVNLDPHHMQHGHVQVPLDALGRRGVDPSGGFAVRDLLDGTRYQWRGDWNYVRLDPGVRQGHIFKLEV